MGTILNKIKYRMQKCFKLSVQQYTKPNAKVKFASDATLE